MNGKQTLARIRKICIELPECAVDGKQHHKLSVRTKTMGWHTVDHHGDGRISLAIRGTKGDNARLVDSDPTKFFLPPYMAHHGYIGVYLDLANVDWDEVREFVLDAYRLVAPKRLVAQLDDRGH